MQSFSFYFLAFARFDVLLFCLPDSLDRNISILSEPNHSNRRRKMTDLGIPVARNAMGPGSSQKKRLELNGCPFPVNNRKYNMAEYPCSSVELAPACRRQVDFLDIGHEAAREDGNPGKVPDTLHLVPVHTSSIKKKEGFSNSLHRLLTGHLMNVHDKSTLHLGTLQRTSYN